MQHGLQNIIISTKHKNPRNAVNTPFLRLSEQGMRESNSHQRFWRPLSYHLTNPLYCFRTLDYYTKGNVVCQEKMIFFVTLLQLWLLFTHTPGKRRMFGRNPGFSGRKLPKKWATDDVPVKSKVTNCVTVTKN